MNDIFTITTDELLRRLGNGNRLELWNVQSHSRFEGELIPGSRRMPLDSIEMGSATIARDAEIITYCGSHDCAQSVEAARRLLDVGYTNVRAYRDGLHGWKRSGYGTVPPHMPHPPAPAA